MFFNRMDKTIISLFQLIVIMSLHKLCFFQGIFAFVNWAGIKCEIRRQIEEGK
jgi:hypothetical protein